ncbi:Cell cycle checkpoint control protein RAD9B [Armadillidium vulgare]|nr:Cell cycle checkpoint control protein RAD9B [Armadillidium vulgare]
MKCVVPGLNIKSVYFRTACLNAFKSINNIDRIVEKCRLIIDPEEDRLAVNMMCRHGIHKTYNLSFIECETLQVVFDKNSCKYSITSQSRVLYDAFINFQASQEEVTLSATPQKIHIRNYVDDDPDPAKAIHTELTLEADEFDSYSIANSCEVTFCLKEVRSLLSFSEPSNLPICLHYSNPGSPIIFSVENSSSFEATFVLATLSSGIDVSQQSSIKAPQINGKMSNNTLVNGKTNCIPSSSSPNRFNSSKGNPFTGISDSIDINQSHSNLDLNNSRLPSSQENILLQVRNQRTNNLADQSMSSPQETKRLKTSLGRTFSNGGTSQREPGESSFALHEEEKEEDFIPGTPPAKRKRFFFKRCFEPTFDANNISGFSKILAEDSDDEQQ